MLLDVTHVQVKPNFTLLLEFEDGEQRRFEMAAYIDQKPWIKNSPAQPVKTGDNSDLAAA